MAAGIVGGAARAAAVGSRVFVSRSLRQFAKRMFKRSSNVKTNGGLLAADVSADLLPELVAATPLDTAKARWNWRVAIGRSVPRAEREPLDSSGEGAVAEGLALIAAAPSGATISVISTSSYIDALNAGSSDQAPAGFIEATTQRVFERSFRSGTAILESPRRRRRRR